MPSSNHTDVDSDYAVSNPPPSGAISPGGVVTVAAITAAVGALMMLAAYTVAEAAALFYAGFGITIVGVTGVAYGLNRISREGLCALARTNFLPKNSYDPCPQVWPVSENGLEVTFYEAGTLKELAKARVFHANALVSLVESESWLSTLEEEAESNNAIQVYTAAMTGSGDGTYAAMVFGPPS